MAHLSDSEKAKQDFQNSAIQSLEQTMLLFAPDWLSHPPLLPHRLPHRFGDSGMAWPQMIKTSAEPVLKL